MALNGRFIPSLAHSCGLWRTVILLAVLCSTATGYGFDYGGAVSENYVESRSDTVRSVAFDQQYQFRINGTAVPTILYFGTITYRNLKMMNTRAPAMYRSELLPSGSAVWSPPYAQFRVDYAYRENRDQSSASRLTGRSGGVQAQSTWSSLPRITGRYQWDQNVNDLELLGTDTRQRLWMASADYSFSSTMLHYGYTDQQTENKRTGLLQVTRGHTGHFDNSLSFLNRVVSLQSNYLVTVRSSHERQAGTDAILVPLAAVSGLWGVNPTPEFGALDPQPGLIDGNVDAAASSQMNLSGTEVQNFGLDLGTPVTVDHLFLYADTLANANMRWAIYTSTDNLTWTQVEPYRTYPFSITFRRFEIPLHQQLTRYLKLVMDPQPAERPVHVSELRALVIRGDNTNMPWVADHQAGIRLGLQPAKWLSGSVEGSISRQGRSPIRKAREQDGLLGSIYFAPTQLFRLSGQYHFGRTEFPDAAGGRTDTDLLGFSLTSKWLSGLQTTISANRQREVTQHHLGRRMDAANIKIDALFLPGLSGSTDAGISQDHRFVGADLFETRYIGQSIQAQPWDAAQFAATYRYYALDSKSSWTPPYRENISLQGIIRLSQTLNLTGSATRFRESGRIYSTWESLLSWSPTEKLLFSGSANRVVPSQGSKTLLLSGQGTFRWSTRSEIFGGYSQYNSDHSRRENFSTVQFGLTYRI